ncbi:hypothetical protein [Mesorhizobium sp. M0659]|uniref:hypothetical protein n=1 Tax=Mesorhizobium sp. M0659 TaxID=2956980 RepID=UPI00333A96B6
MAVPINDVETKVRVRSGSDHDDGLVGLHMVVATALPPCFAPAGGPCLCLAAQPALAVLKLIVVFQ